MSKIGDWIQTYTGRQVWPLSLETADIDIRDIAHALSCIGRFNGHARQFYSVAQHSVLASAFVWNQPLKGDETPAMLDARLDDQRWALLHDAHEAYIGDIARPMKQRFYELDRVKGDIDAVIRRRFGLADREEGRWAIVHAVDEVLLATEKRDLMAPGVEWPDLVMGPLEHRIQQWTWRYAEEKFLARFQELFGNTSGVARHGEEALT